MQIKGAIFDLDGTLLDSMFIWDTIGADYLRARGITPQPGLNEIFKSMSIVQAAGYYQAHYGLRESVEEITGGVNAMIEGLYAERVAAKPGAAALLAALQARGTAMCVATATDRYMASAALRRNGLDGYFRDILTCTEVGFGKDSPVIFERALAVLGTRKADTLVFEDALYAAQTAKRAGFRVAGVADASAAEDAAALRALCDVYLEDLESGCNL